jgi:hypothetical protein
MSHSRQQRSLNWTVLGIRVFAIYSATAQAIDEPQNPRSTDSPAASHRGL